jgi:hypothetical protein
MALQQKENRRHEMRIVVAKTIRRPENEVYGF